MFDNLDIARLKYILTMDCNFRCDYCFEGGKTKKHLDVEEAIKIGKQVIDEMKQQDLTVLYFGGEPFLRFRDMQLITQSLHIYANKKNKNLKFTAITNGTIMTDEIVKHLSQYKYYMSVSCDGMQSAHNMHRGYLNGMMTSFPIVEKTIKTLNSCTKDLCVSMVVTDQNSIYLSQSFEWLIDIGIRNFAISPILDNYQYTPTPTIYEQQLMEVADIAAKVPERIVINPPLDKAWDDSNSARLMYRSEESVNIEVSPLGINIIQERSFVPPIDFGLDGSESKKIPASSELRDAIIEVERNASRYYANLKNERKKD